MTVSCGLLFSLQRIIAFRALALDDDERDAVHKTDDYWSPRLMAKSDDRGLPPSGMKVADSKIF
jgi:hypothetical protein